MSDTFAKVVIPQLDANADIYRVVELCVADRTHIAAGTAVAVIETSKSVFEIETSAGGYLLFAPNIGRGHEVRAGQLLAIVADAEPPDDAVFGTLASDTDLALEARTLGVTFSHAATRRMRELGIAPEAFRGKGLITAADVESYYRTRPH